MTVSVNVNGLSVVHERSDGVSQATLPDVCTSPKAGAVPYPNVAFSRDLVGGSKSVRMDRGSSVALDSSSFATSRGDEEGTLGGVVSGTYAAEATWLTHSFDVRIEGQPVCRLTDKMLHNHGNTVDCAGETQPVVNRDHTVIDLSKMKSPYAGHYSLQVDAILPVPGTPKKVTVEDARVVITAVDKAKGGEEASFEGNTKRGGRGGKAGRCVFKGLAKKRFKVEVLHDCYAEDPKNLGKAYANAKPKKYQANMVAGILKDVANAKNIQIGARVDSLLGRELSTLDKEFNEVIEGTFFGSRCGDVHFFNWPNDFIAVNQDLTDLSRLPDGSFVQQPSYDFAPSQAVRDAAAARNIGVGYSAARDLLNVANAHNKTVQSTPLVWPAPSNTPAWANGTKEAPGGYVDRRAGALIAAGMSKKEATKKAVREVLENFIVTVMSFRKSEAQANGKKTVASYVVVNEVLNTRYHGAQENATPDKVYAREHPFWTAFGVWDVDDEYRKTKDTYQDIWDHVRFCFEVAHQTDPDAILILNDFNVEYLPKKYNRKQLEADASAALVEPMKDRKAAVDKADKALETTKKKIEARWEKDSDERRDASPAGAANAFKDALAAAARAFEKSMLTVQAKFAKDLQGAEHHSEGRGNLENQYKFAVAVSDKLYKDAVTATTTTYTQALAKAETDFTAARAAEVTTPGFPPDTKVLPANDAQRKHEKELHEAGLRRFKSLHSHTLKHAKAVHKATRTFGKLRASAGGHRDSIIQRWEKPELFYQLAKWLTHNLSPGAKSKLAIGYQMHHPDTHLAKGYSPQAIAKQTQRFAKLNLPVMVTELDVTTEGSAFALNQDKLDIWRRKRDRYNRKLRAWKKKKANERGAKPKWKLKRPKPKWLKDEHEKVVEGGVKTFIDHYSETHKPMDGETPEAYGARRLQDTDKERARLELEFYKKYKRVFLPVFREQAERTRHLIKALCSAKNVTSINTWSVGDRAKGFRYVAYWFHWGWPCPTKDCLMHNDPSILHKKPAYSAALSAFLDIPKQFTDAEIRAGKAKAWVKKLEKRS